MVLKYKNKEAHIVEGQHEGLISEVLFYKVQDVLDGRKRNIGVNNKGGVTIVSKELLPLRGFLTCDRCFRMLTGSASKGRNGYHYYYHCRSACGWRVKAETVNMAFVDKLRRFVPRTGVAELFKEVVRDLYSDYSKRQAEQRSKILAEITLNNNRINKARELLLQDNISPQDYKIIKTEAEQKIIRLEATFKDLKNKVEKIVDIEALIYKAVETLKKLDLLYIEADIRGKRETIGSIFPEKWFFRMDSVEPQKSIMRLNLSIRLTIS